MASLHFVNIIKQWLKWQICAFAVSFTLSNFLFDKPYRSHEASQKLFLFIYFEIQCSIVFRFISQFSYLQCHFPHFSLLKVLDDVFVEIFLQRFVRFALRVTLPRVSQGIVVPFEKTRVLDINKKKILKIITRTKKLSIENNIGKKLKT